ncbi:MAG: 30S ribosomal protein S9 [Patescibacteria group bacterium]
MDSKKTAAKTAADKEKYFYGRGGRKTATARVRLFLKGKGEITVNDQPFAEYFPTKDMQDAVMKPLILTGHEKNTNLLIRVVGSGKIAQSIAVRHGVARALLVLNPELRPVLKAEGCLTRDPRVKERKKPGLKRARRAPQWAKR